MEISDILVIDNNRKIYPIITKYLEKKLEQVNLKLCTNKKNLNKLLKENDFDVFLINNNIKWEKRIDLLNFLSIEQPFIGRVLFSETTIEPIYNEKSIKTDASIQHINSNIEHLEYIMRFAVERATERSEAFSIFSEYKELFDNVPIGLYKIDYTGKLLTCNKVLAVILGYEDPSEIINTKIQGYFFKDQDSKSAIHTYSNSPYIVGKLKLRKKDGTQIWVEIDTKATYSEDNILLFLHGSVKDISKQIELEEEVKKSYHKMQLYLDLADTYFVVLDNKLNVQMVNDRIANLFEMSKEGMLGKKWIDLISKGSNNKEKIEKTIQEMFFENNTNNKSKEITMNLLDSNDRTFLWKSNTIKNDKNEVEAIICTGIEITERIKAEYLLRENEEKYRKLVETSPNSILLTNLDGRIVFANQQLLKMHGYDSDKELADKNISLLLADSSITRTYKRVEIKRLIEDESKTEILMARKDGSTFPAEINGSYLRDDQGKPIGILIIGNDISDRKKAELTIKNSEKLYRTIFESTGTNMIVVDLNQKIVICNKLFEKFVGLKKDEIEGKSWKSLIHPNDYDELFKVTSDMINKPESFPKEIEFRVKGNKGFIRNVWAVIDVIPDGNQAVVSIHDVTEKTIMDEVKKQTYDQIEKNMEQFAILVDAIRNPLAVITSITDISDINYSQDLINQVNLIDNIITELDQRWLESINVRNFLKEHL